MVSCIVMASGHSRRLGRDKLFLKCGEKTLIEMTIERLQETSLDEIVVVYRDDRVLELIDKYRVKTVYNGNSELGQSESIKLGILNSSVDTDGYMFTVADQPFIKGETIEKLMGIFKRDKSKIALLKSGEKNGNPVIFPRACREELLSLEGDTGGRALIENHGDSLSYLAVKERELFDIDTESDVEVLNRRDDMRETVVVRGAGDLATGIGHRLHRSGFNVLMLEIEKPLVIRRTVSYAQAVYDGEIVINGVKGVMVKSREEIATAWDREEIPVLVDENADIVSEIETRIVVDAILAKKNLGTTIDMAEIVIGVGPGFTAGVDVDAVVETKRGHYLGSVILDGAAIPNTGIPGTIGGYDKERVIHSPADGIIENVAKIGDVVEVGDTIAKIGETDVKAEIPGVLRGLIQNGIEVYNGLKIADIDPRGEVDHCFTISDKARAIAGGVLEAIMYKTFREKE